MRILIFGDGYLGNHINRFFKWKNCAILDGRRIECYDDIEKAIQQFSPTIIINCIGFTGHTNVDDCEDDIDKTLYANTMIPIMMAEACVRSRVKFIHISSGCIYHFDLDGEVPIVETIMPDFYDLFYSRSKIYAENMLEGLMERENILSLRIRIPLDDIPHPRNILTKLISFGKVINVPNSVTYIPHFLYALEHLIKINATGTYNVVNGGELRYPDLLDCYSRYSDGFEYEVIPLETLPTPRTNLTMSTEKLSSTGFFVHDINTILNSCTENYAQNERALKGETDD